MTSYLVIAPQGLGDALEATPIVAALRRARPSAKIDALVLRPGPRRLYLGLDDVDEVLYYPYWERGMAAFLASLARDAFRRRTYDASFLAYPASRPEYGALARFHRADVRVAHDYEARGSSRTARSIRVPVEPKHNVERNLDLVRALGIDAGEPVRYLVPPSWTDGNRDSRRIAVHVGTVTHHRLSNHRWPVERFAELARRLLRDGFDVGVISGPDERAESAALAAAAEGARTIEGTLDEIARYLSTCAGAVTNDSGIGHLAAAVGTTVIALHGPTPVEGGPFGPNAISFRPSTCPPCFDPRRRNTSCALGIDFACLKKDLTVDLVEQRLLRELRDRTGIRSR